MLVIYTSNGKQFRFLNNEFSNTCTKGILKLVQNKKSCILLTKKRHVFLFFKPTETY